MITGKDFDDVTPEHYSDAQVPDGTYLVQLLDIKQKQGFNGFSFIFELCLAQDYGDLKAGTPVSIIEKPYRNAKVTKKIFGKIKCNVAALLGIDSSNHMLVGEKVKSQQLTDATHNQETGKRSPLRGRLAVMRVNSDKRPMTAEMVAAGKTPFQYKELSTYLENGQIVTRPIAGEAAPVASAPAASTPVAPPPPPVVAAPAAKAFPPAGWLPHTTPEHAAAGWYYEVASGGTNIKHEKDLRAL